MRFENTGARGLALDAGSSLNLNCTHDTRMLHSPLLPSMLPMEKKHRMQVESCDAEAIVNAMNSLPKPGQLACGSQNNRCAGFHCLFVRTVHCPTTQAASHFQEEIMNKISRNIHFIPHGLLNTLF